MNGKDSTFEKICNVLRDLRVEVAIVNGKRIAAVTVHADLGVYSFAFWENKTPSLLHACLVSPTTVPEDFRSDVAELIVRANDTWLFGSLSLNMSTGSVTWNASIPVEDGEITARQLRHLLDGGIGMTALYLPAIDRLVHDENLSPAEAVAEVEMAVL